MRAADPEARRGDIEGVHRLRTSTRRLRSELRTVGDLVETSWRERLEGELKWLADMLGSVRDLDILCQRLRAAWKHDTPKASANGKVAEVCTDGPLRPLFESLCERHSRNSRTLREGLQSQRYRNLLGTLEDSIDSTPLKEEALQPCRSVLPALSGASWRRLKKGARALRPSDPDSDFHEIRKRAKRARYTAELIAPALGRRVNEEAARFIRITIGVQDVLGEHQDAIVAATEIEQFLAEHSDDKAFANAAADLIESQQKAAQAARDAFFDAWKKLDRKKSLRWLKRKIQAET
jgi:CHAD domain-containing protein